MADESLVGLKDADVTSNGEPVVELVQLKHPERVGGVPCMVHAVLASVGFEGTGEHPKERAESAVTSNGDDISNGAAESILVKSGVQPNGDMQSAVDLDSDSRSLPGSFPLDSVSNGVADTDTSRKNDQSQAQPDYLLPLSVVLGVWYAL